MRAKERLASYGVDSLSLGDLREVIVGRRDGFTRLQKQKLKAAVELGRRHILAEELSVPRVITAPEDAKPVVVGMLGALEREEFVVLLLNARNALIEPVRVAAGTTDACALHPRDVFRPALEAGATGVIIAHNHPSGNSKPSPEDATLTRRIVEGGRALGIRVLDHLIVAGDTLVSLRSLGLGGF